MKTSDRGGLKVLSRNLYLGANFKVLLPPVSRLRLHELTANFYRFVTLTAFDERVELIASEIEDRTPDVLCLQEVYEYRFRTSALTLNFLALLQAALCRRRLDYSVVSLVNATRARLPIMWSGKPDEVEVTDSIAILVREGVSFQRPGGDQFDTGIDLTMPNEIHPDAMPLNVRRACQYVEILSLAQPVVVANTHLESISEAIQGRQARELLTRLDSFDQPVILAGDLNAAPGSDIYNLFVNRGDGYQDGFAARNQNTWGTGDTLTEEFMDLRQRIDHIFHSPALTCTATDVFGHTQRTEVHGLFPSDHAGLMGTYAFAG